MCEECNQDNHPDLQEHYSFSPCSVVLPDGEHLQNMFGCYEMEKAAFAILKQLIKAGDWLADVDYFEFMNGDRQLLKGFIMLAVHGWIATIETDGICEMEFSFRQRIMQLLPVPVERRHLEKL